MRLSEDSLPGTVYALCPYFVLLCRQKDLEEASSAYKNIDEVMANQSDLTRIVTALEPIAVIKGV